MSRFILLFALMLGAAAPSLHAQSAEDQFLRGQPSLHPDTSGPEWSDLFAPDLSGALRPVGVWSMENGILTATEDQVLWTGKVYDNAIIDLEFRNAEGTNSGVFVYVSDIIKTVPNSVEIQIADDYAEKWATAPKSWQAGAIFGHVAPTKSAVNRPGEWNRMTILCRDEQISVLLNGELVSEMDMSMWWSARVNPDGSEIPEWLSIPKADLPTYGHIGLQGKHGDAPIWFRNLRIKEVN